MNNLLSIKNFKVAVNEKIILDGINLDIEKGQIHTIMGPNGSGKSTLAQTLMGNPEYKVTEGEIIFRNLNLLGLTPDKRAKLGLFLAFQNPYEIEGVSIKDLLYIAYNSIYQNSPQKLSFSEFRNLLEKKSELLKISPEFLSRSVNVGFSGGEKKKLEILQMAVLQPALVILDEIDSGLDIDALKIICDGINRIKTEFKDLSLLIITHYPRILNYLKPDFVHILQAGKIVKTGDATLATKIEKVGYK